MTDTPQHLAEKLLADGEKTLAFFDPLTQQQWSIEVYTDGMVWCVREVLCHFASSETSFNRLLENILEGGEGSPEGFNIDAYNQRKVAQLEKASTEELLNSYKLARLKNVEIVSRLQPEDLQRTGRHPFLGVATLEDIIKLIYRHNQIHLRDVRKLLG